MVQCKSKVQDILLGDGSFWPVPWQPIHILSINSTPHTISITSWCIAIECQCAAEIKMQWCAITDMIWSWIGYLPWCWPDSYIDTVHQCTSCSEWAATKNTVLRFRLAVQWIGYLPWCRPDCYIHIVHQCTSCSELAATKNTVLKFTLIPYCQFQSMFGAAPSVCRHAI